MVKRKRIQRGDIIFIDLNPTIGREIHNINKTGLPALVLSTAEFNANGMVFLAPITQGGQFARDAGFAVSLTTTGTKTQGVILVNQCRMIDIQSRGYKLIESVPDYIIDDALARIQAIID